jgi:endo-1,4-beta-xylanase
MMIFLKKILGFSALIGVGLLTNHSAYAQSTVCTYNITNEWNTGLTGSITIANTGTAAVSGWGVSWQYVTNKLTSSWNATVSGSNPYAAVALSWNNSIPAGQSVSFGFQVDKNGGVAEKPVVGGRSCEGAPKPSSAASSIKSSVAKSVAASAKSSVASSKAASIKSSVASSVTASVKSSVASSKAASSKSSVASSVAKSTASSAGVVSLKALADFPIGMAVNAGNEANSIISSGTSAQQQAVVFPHFNQFTAGNIMKMSYLHPSESTFTFTQADNLITFASANGIKMHAHTLIWHSDYQVPSYMKSYTGDFSAMLKTHVQTIAAHFSGKVASWDVVNEALAEDGDTSAVNGYRNSIFYQKLGTKFIDEAFIHARAADPVADLYYNDFNIENNGTKTTNLLAMIDGMKTRGIPITGVGFQMHVLLDWPSTSTIESTLKAVASRGFKVKITELDVRVNNIYNASSTKYTSLTAAAAALQKERYRQIVTAYLKVVPAAQRGGITVWGVWDADSWLNTAAEPDWPLLFDVNFLPKPALQGFADGLTGK